MGCQLLGFAQRNKRTLVTIESLSPNVSNEYKGTTGIRVVRHLQIAAEGPNRKGIRSIKGNSLRRNPCPADRELNAHAASASFSSLTIVRNSFPNTWAAFANPPSPANGVRSKSSMS